MINFNTVKLAIQKWAVAGSGMPGQHVFWEGQGNAADPNAHILLRYAGLRTMGRDWFVERQVGDSIERYQIGSRIFLVGIEYHGPTEQQQNQASGLDILDRVVMSEQIESLNRLHLAGVGIGNKTDILTIPRVFNAAVFSLEATVTVQFHLQSVALETIPTFNSIRINGVVSP